MADENTGPVQIELMDDTALEDIGFDPKDRDGEFKPPDEVPSAEGDAAPVDKDAPPAEGDAPPAEDGKADDEPPKAADEDSSGDADLSAHQPDETPGMEETLSALDAGDEIPPPDVPALTEHQQFVSDLFPNREVAQYAAESMKLVNPLYQGRSTEFLDGLKATDPQVYQGLLDEVYKANIEGWVDRFVQQHDPDAHPAASNPEMAQLQARLDKYDQFFEGINQQRTQQTQANTSKQQLEAIDGYMTKRFDAMKLPDPDRVAIRKMVLFDISQDPDVMKRARGGEVHAIRDIFRDVVNPYITSDKERRGKAAAAKQVKEEDTKPPIEGGDAEVSEGVTSWEEQAAEFVRNH